MSSHLWMSKRDEIPDRCSTNSTMENPTAVLPVLVLVLLHSHELLASGCEFNSSRQHHHRHVHVGPTGERVIVVDATGSGNFLSVQEAVDSIAENNTMRVIVQINAGYYIEKVVVPTSKPYITFQGSGKESTVIEWHDRASDRGPNGQQLRTYQTASVTVFELSSGAITWNGRLASGSVSHLRDKAYFFGCGFYGAQDTLCDDAGRHYFKDCYIEGSIDFIFGNGRSMYKNCWLHSIANRFGSIAAQDRHSPCERTGFSFVDCRVTGTGKLYVGRAMGQYSRIVFAYTYFEDVVAPGGWDDWGHDDAKNKCWGPGADSVRSASRARELDSQAARPFLVKSFVNGRHWLGPSDA
ncbi:hypothetical protein HPP92_026224 [Vanilla planifolia]|uniref:Pectinesterase n=1 Tax=Vanilla planifolia TaxID=51239 RepID=A0A835UA63_VANPL|nr:hypothetical protein HPP92_026224 [Vanilla planifolia]